MNFKKTVVSALSVSALALSVGGVASAKEVNSSPTQIQEAKHVSVSDKISIQNYSITLYLGGDPHQIREPLATSFASDNSYVASVSSRGIIYANHRGNAKITLFKSDGSVLGAVYVTVE
ncbi:Ig-like domain-containing protein [Bacillus subtilis]|uniref:Ig-like domain-containing protein n=1 Tax=Bacillus sp. SW14 TaxID=3391618 RepID=UPI002FDAD883